MRWLAWELRSFIQSSTWLVVSVFSLTRTSTSCSVAPSQLRDQTFQIHVHSETIVRMDESTPALTVFDTVSSVESKVGEDNFHFAGKNLVNKYLYSPGVPNGESRTTYVSLLTALSSRERGVLQFRRKSFYFSLKLLLHNHSRLVLPLKLTSASPF